MIKVLVVDDSPLVRAMLKDILNAHPKITVVATARDPFDAREKIKIHSPDVLTLDVEMPRMDGVTFLKNLMRLRPMPVVMVSSLTEKGAGVTLQALELGAVDYLEKPRQEKREEFESYAEIITSKVLAAASANVRTIDIEQAKHIAEKYQKNKSFIKKLGVDVELIAIGASTGGTEAIKELLLSIPEKMPPIVIVQHIPPVFSTSYAKRIDSMIESVAMEVSENDTRLIPGYVYLAPGDKHMEVYRSGGALKARLLDTEPVNRHKPAVDVLFDSVEKTVKDKALGVLLTGMGQDGAKGLLKMKKAGATTIVQDEKSSVVWGMPGAAVELGAASEVLALNKIGQRLVKLIYG